MQHQQNFDFIKIGPSKYLWQVIWHLTPSPSSESKTHRSKRGKGIENRKKWLPELTTQLHHNKIQPAGMQQLIPLSLQEKISKSCFMGLWNRITRAC